MKYSSLLLLALCCTAAQAHQPFSGFYATLGGGGTQAKFQVNQSVVGMTMVGNGGQTIPASLDTQAGSWMGSLGLGYAYEFENHFVIGAEITAGIANAVTSHISQASLDQDSNVTQYISPLEANFRNDFAFLVKPGYVFNQVTQLYVLIGPRWGNFETSSSIDITNMAVGVQNSASGQASGYTIGVTAGVGMERLITRHLGLGLEYAYTYYGTIDTPTMSMQVGNLEVTNNPAMKASTNTFMVDLTYHF